jgi:uncharacterized membrane protein
VNLSTLLRGLPGHPSHPPLTDATIGIYTFATIAALADVFGVSDDAAAHGWWLALATGLIVTVPTALTGLADWLTIESGTPLKRTATTHLIAMVAASVVFLLALLVGRDSFDAGDISAGPLVLTLVAYGLLAFGGWLGGSLVFGYGMRVLNLVDQPASSAASPVPTREEEEAERG